MDLCNFVVGASGEGCFQSAERDNWIDAFACRTGVPLAANWIRGREAAFASITSGSKSTSPSRAEVACSSVRAVK
ncbi:hypothetical protein ACETU7_21300 [Rhodococcus sp. 3Y1]